MIIAAMLSLGIIGISVTRSYLVVFATTVLFLLVIIPKKHAGTLMLRMAFSLGVLLAILALISISFPEVRERWFMRIFTSSRAGFDLTGATRIAEATYQIQRLLQEPMGLFFGFGMRGETHFAGENVKLIQSVLGNKGIDYSAHGYGHIFYVGLFYVGGIFCGGIVLLSFIRTLIRSTVSVKSLWKSSSTDFRFAALWGISGTAGFLAYGFLGGTWGDRSTSFFFLVSATG